MLYESSEHICLFFLIAIKFYEESILQKLFNHFSWSWKPNFWFWDVKCVPVCNFELRCHQLAHYLLHFQLKRGVHNSGHVVSGQPIHICTSSKCKLLTVVGHSFDRTFNLGRRRLRLKLKPKSLVAEQFLLYLLLRDLQADFDVLFYDRYFVCFCGSLQEVNELVVLLFRRHLVLNDTKCVCRWRISNCRLVE